MRDNRVENLPPPAASSPPRRLFRDQLEIRIFAVLFVVMVFFLSIGPGRTQGARVMAHAYALLHEHRNAIDTCHWNTIDKAYFQGHYFASAGPGMGYLALVPLAAFERIYALLPAPAVHAIEQKMRSRLQQQEQHLIQDGYLSFDPAVNQVGLLEFHASIWFFELFIALLMAAAAVVFYRLLGAFEVSNALAGEAALVLGLGTILFYYSRMACAVVPAAFCLLLAFYQLVRVRQGPKAPAGTAPIRLVASGLALGAAVAIEYIQIIGAALIFLYGWRCLGTRRACWLALGGIPVGILIMLYHYAAFGNPFTFPHQHLIPLFTEHSAGLLGLTYPSPDRIAALAAGLRRGMLVYSPILILPLVLLVRNAFFSRRHAAEALLVLGLFVGYLLFQATSPLVGQTWGIGPRYVAAVTPFLMLGVIYIRTPFQRRAFHFLAILSVLVSWLTVQRDIEPKHSAAPLLDATSAFLRSGPTSSLLEQGLSLSRGASPLRSLAVNLAAYAILAGLLWLIWQVTAPKPTPDIAPVPNP
jgi:hypothetical protein